MVEQIVSLIPKNLVLKLTFNSSKYIWSTMKFDKEF